MSLKSIDMSMAVHKNAEAAQIQRELQQKPAMDQAALAGGSLKTAESSSKRAAKLEETDKSLIREGKDEGGRGSGKGRSGARSRSSGASSTCHEDSGHPYKGHHIDLSL